MAAEPIQQPPQSSEPPEETPQAEQPVPTEEPKPTKNGFFTKKKVIIGALLLLPVIFILTAIEGRKQKGTNGSIEQNLISPPPLRDMGQGQQRLAQEKVDALQQYLAAIKRGEYEYGRTEQDLTQQKQSKEQNLISPPQLRDMGQEQQRLAREKADALQQRLAREKADALQQYLEANKRREYEYGRSKQDLTQQKQSKEQNLISPPQRKSELEVAYVTAQGGKLWLGGRPFRFIGFNRYDFLTVDVEPGEPYQRYKGCGDALKRSDLGRAFAELGQIGTRVVRIWAFQEFTESGNDFSRLDYLLNVTSQNNIKVIPVLENQWADCTRGGYKFNGWYRSGYLSPYGNYPISYKEYVRRIVTRYKDNPTIMAWELINEVDGDNQDGPPDLEAFASFTRDISSYIKSLDQNHLVTISTNQVFRTINSIPTIDLLDYHDYGDETTPIPPDLSTVFLDAASLNKPVILGEAGIKSNCQDADCFTGQQRSELFKAKMEAFFQKDKGAGYLIWRYGDVAGSEQDKHKIVVSDPTMSVVRDIAPKLLP